MAWSQRGRRDEARSPAPTLRGTPGSATRSSAGRQRRTEVGVGDHGRPGPRRGRAARLPPEQHRSGPRPRPYEDPRPGRPRQHQPVLRRVPVAVQRAAATRGFALVTISPGSDPAVELRGMLDLCDRQIDGLLLARGTGADGAAELTRRGVRTPWSSSTPPPPYPGYTTIGSAAAAGIAAVTDHLLPVHGHPSVSLILGDTTIPRRRARGRLAEGPRQEPPLPGPDRAGPFTRTGGYAAGLRLLRGPRGRPRSSPVRTCRPSACCAPPASRVSAFPRTSRWRASTAPRRRASPGPP